jgi:Flp pilus assembly protein TadD
MNKMIVKLALSTAVVGFTAVGGAGVIAASASSEAAPNAHGKKVQGWAIKAEKLLAKGKTEQALSFAEAAVEADLVNVEYRSLLARVYLAQGRFVAAERTFEDVMELGQADPRTVIGVALSRIAQGKVDSAISLVDANRAILPASDYGLALALAGDQKRAIDVLTDAIRADNASARTRQNLAMAYALDGRWRDARVMAVQDLPQNSADMRLAEWVQLARPGAYQMRVASLLKVVPREDAGQPVRLALGNAAKMPAMAAVEAPVEAAMASFAPAPVAELAATGPAPDVASAEESDEVAPAAVPAQVAVPAPQPAYQAPLIKAAEGPVKAAAAAPADKPVKLALADVPTPKAKAAGRYVVQLGAFSSAANAQKAWTQYTKKHSILKGFSSLNSTTTIKGKSLTRLAAAGFGNLESAYVACRQIKAGGGDCIVKASDGSSPVRMASKGTKKPVRIASKSGKKFVRIAAR